MSRGMEREAVIQVSGAAAAEIMIEAARGCVWCGAHPKNIGPWCCPRRSGLVAAALARPRAWRTLAETRATHTRRRLSGALRRPMLAWVASSGQPARESTGPPAHNSLRDASLPLQPCMPAPAPTYHRTHASTAWLPARKGFRGRHRQHPRHGTAKLPPITACPLEPTPRPFALLNDRPRQRMRGASTLDVTTAPPKEGSKAFPFSFSRDPPEQTRRAAGELSDATLHVPVKLDTLRLRKSLGSALVVGRPSSPPHDALQRPVPLSSTSSAFSLRL